MRTLAPLLTAAACWCALCAPAQDVPESYPDWWIEYGIIRLGQDHHNNTAILNQGQAKYFTQQAIRYLDDRLELLGGATFVLEDRLSAQAPSHFSPLNIGQLKNLTAPFYDRFSEVGFLPGADGWPATLILDAGGGDTSPQYPWLADTGSDNYKSANLGQIKHLFSWEVDTWITLDADTDGLPDYWEQLIFKADPLDSILTLQDVDPTQDFDGDGLTNLGEFQAGTDPALSDTDGDGIPDGVEVDTGLNPHAIDNTVRREALLGYLPLDIDTEDATNTLVTTATSVTLDPNAGRVGGSAILAGGSGKIVFQDHVDLNSLGPYTTRTFSIWFQVNSITGGRQVLLETGESSRGFSVYVDNGTLYAGAWDQIQDQAVNDIDTWPGTWIQSQNIQAATWHHLVLVLDAASTPTELTPGALHIYLDGEKISNNEAGMQIFTHGPASLGGVDGSILMHDGTLPTPNGLTGRLDEFMVWNRALSSAEVAILSFHLSGPGGQTDEDGDGLTNHTEFTLGTDPNLTDSDYDGIADADEVNHATYTGLDPANADTDGDGMNDGFELANGYDPTNPADGVADTDGDGLTNGEESQLGTDITLVDTDADGATDYDEVQNETNPLWRDHPEVELEVYIVR